MRIEDYGHQPHMIGGNPNAVNERMMAFLAKIE